MIETEITTEILYVFPPEQTFELAVLDGCVNGNFMVGDSINVYFADALQPIKFVTADEIDPEFDKVLIRVGTDLDGGGGGAGRPVKVGNEEEEKIVIEERSRVDTLRAGFEKMIAEKKAEAEAKKKEEGGNEPQAPIVPLCYPYGPSKEFNFNKNVVVGDECDEEIVVCANLDPQILQESSFLKLRRNVDYIWIDEDGNSHTSNTGNACLFDPPLKGRLDLGKCYTFEIIGNYAASTDIYYLLDDIIKGR